MCIDSLSLGFKKLGGGDGSGVEKDSRLFKKIPNPAYM